MPLFSVTLSSLRRTVRKEFENRKTKQRSASTQFTRIHLYVHKLNIQHVRKRGISNLCANK